MKYICDTNFILRYLLGDNPAMLAKTKEIFEQAKSGQITLIIEQTVFTEVIFVLSSFYKVPKDKITQILAELLAYKGISGEKKVLSLALDYHCKHKLHIVDCLLIAKAKLTQTPILTFDQKLDELTKAS
jgi:predicted nucleic acid-binding protein